MGSDPAEDAGEAAAATSYLVDQVIAGISDEAVEKALDGVLKGVFGGQGMAAPRDASLFRYPGMATKLHISTVDWMAECNKNRGILRESAAQKAENVPADLRCQRSGCRERWPQEATASL